jgi:WD40 repeat protein
MVGPAMLRGHEHRVKRIALAPTSFRVASSGGHDLRLWDTVTGAPVAELRGHSDWIRELEFSADGRLLASSSRDGTVRLWDAETGASIGVLEDGGDVTSSAFSPDGTWMASSSDKFVKLWAIGWQSGRLVTTPEPRALPREYWAGKVFFSPDGTLIAAPFWGRIKIWEVATGLEQTLEQLWSGDYVNWAAFSVVSQFEFRNS